MKSTQWANDLLLLLYNNVDAALIGDAGGLQHSGAAGSLYLSLHTADPGAGGDQTTHEVAYTSYVRKGVARDNTHWTVAAGQAVNALTTAWAACTGSSATATHVGIGTASSGAGKLLYSQPLIAAYFDGLGKTATNIITAPGHTLVVNDTVQVVAPVGGTLPSGLAASTTYFVRTVSGGDLTLSTTLGGSTLALGSDGTVLIGKIAALSIASGITPQVSPSGIVHTEV